MNRYARVRDRFAGNARPLQWVPLAACPPVHRRTVPYTRPGRLAARGTPPPIVSRTRYARRAYTVVLAIVLIGLIGITLAVLARYFVSTTRSTRAADLEVRAAQLLAGGQEWITDHAEQCGALSLGAIIELPVDDLMPAGSQASLTITRTSDERVMTLTARVARGRQSATFRIKIP
ncbi:MAG: hypothetical protein ACE5F9_02155 [Phycisphaerae bacterium]